MTPGKLTLNVYQGSDFYLKLTIMDESKNKIDLTGMSFRGEIRKFISSPDVLANFSFNVLDQTTNKGEVEMIMAASVTTDIPTSNQLQPNRQMDKYCYDVEQIDVGLKVTRILEGLVNVSPEVTR